MLTANQQRFPSLSDAQSSKLKQLTVVSLASTQKARADTALDQPSSTPFGALQVLPYNTLMQQLDIASLRELEDMLITDCIYPGLLDARLDQRQQQLIVFHTYGRDVHPDKLPLLLEALEAWYVM